MEKRALPTSRNCRMNFAMTAASIERAAYFALPMPVSEAASVSTPASVAAETEVVRMSETRRARSPSGRAG